MSFLFCLIGIALSSSIYLLSEGLSASPIYFPLLLFIVFSLILCYAKDKSNLRSFWLRPSFICFLSLCVVGFQLCIDHALGYSNLNSTVFAGASRYSDQCFYSAAIFVFSYILGLETTKNIWINYKRETIDINNRYAFCWLLLMVTSFSLFIYTIDLPSYISGAAYYGSGASDYVFTLSNTFEKIYQLSFYITFACYIKIIKNNLNRVNFKLFFKGIPRVFWGVVSLYLVIRLLSGDRGPVIYNFMTIVYGFIWCSKHRFRLITVISLLIIGAMSVSFLGYYRSRDPNLGITEKIIASFERQSEISDRSIINSTKQLAGSVETHFLAVRDISINKTDHSLGRYTLLSLTRAMPGLKTKYLMDMGIEPSFVDSAVYFSISSQGTGYSFGAGSSMFGESFLEFDLLGMLLYGYILGVVFKYLDCILLAERQLSVLNLAVVLNLSAHAIYMGRTSFGIELGSLMHMCVMFCVLNLFIRKVCK